MFDLNVGTMLSFYDGDSIGIITYKNDKKFFEGKQNIYNISWNKVGKNIDKLLSFQKENNYITDDLLEDYINQGLVKTL